MQGAIFLALSVGIIKPRHFLIETKPAAVVNDTEEHAVGVGGFAGVFGAGEGGSDYHAGTDFDDNSNNDYDGTHY